MMRRRMATIAACATALSILAVGGHALLGDPERTVDTVRLEGFTGSATLRSPVGEGPSRPVEGLEQLVGGLRSGEAVEEWSVAGVGVDFGPRAWLLTDAIVGDFDGDGVAAPVLEELRALEGTEVTLGVRYESDRGDTGVFTINGSPLRDADGGPAPWEDLQASPKVERGEIVIVAEEAVGEGARATAAERVEEGGHGEWEVRVRGGDGQGYHVILDLSGTVVDVRATD